MLPVSDLLAPELQRGVFNCRDFYQRWLKSNDRSHSSVASIVGKLANFASNHKCYDPRDRVLGLLGLIWEDFRGEIKFDAATSLTEIYSEFMHFIIIGSEGPESWVIIENLLNAAIMGNQDRNFHLGVPIRITVPYDVSSWKLWATLKPDPSLDEVDVDVTLEGFSSKESVLASS